MANYDIYIYTVSLPDNIHEMVTPCLCGYTIYISDRLTREQMLAAYDHAICHIMHGDFESNDDIHAIEKRAHEEVRSWQKQKD